MGNQNYTAQEIAMVKHIDEFFQKSTEMREECLDYIKAFVRKYGEQTTETTYHLYLFDDDKQDYIGGAISCTYDGGNHPEYDTNAFSTINAVMLNNNNISLCTEDCEDYDIYNINTSEVITLAEHLLEVKEYLNK